MKNRAVIIKSKKGQQLNQREVKLINGENVEGLLLFDVQPRGNSVILTYHTDGLVNLHDFLRMTEMNKRLFVVLMRNILVVLKATEKNVFNKDLIVWDLHTTYIDPSLWQVYMMYVPLQSYETNGNLKLFLQKIVAACSFDSNEDISYVQGLVKEISASISYTAVMLETYCNKISDQLTFEETKKNSAAFCSFCDAKIRANELFCPFCGAKVEKAISCQIDVACCINGEPLSNEKEDSFAVELLKTQKSEMFVNVDKNGILSVFKSVNRIEEIVWIEATKKQEKIQLTKFPFRIGKKEDANYRICNSAVSRKHVDILKEQGEYFLVDLGSTNGTYIDGKKLQPGVKEKICNGSVVRFADEEYKFYISQGE